MALADIITPEEILCVQLALDALPDSALITIISDIDIAINALNTENVFIIYELSNLDIILTPLVIKKNALISLQQTVVAQFKLLDQSIVNQCVALGTLNQTLLSSIDNTAETLTNTINLINMKEAYKIQLQSRQTALQDAVVFLGRTKSAFQSALQVRTQAQVVGQLPNASISRFGN